MTGPPAETRPHRHRWDHTDAWNRQCSCGMQQTRRLVPAPQSARSWTDEQVMEGCGDFKDDGTLMMACSERDVEIDEFRRVLEQAIAYRDRVRPTLAGSRS